MSGYSKGIVATSENRFGEPTIIHRTRYGLKVKRTAHSNILALTAAVAPLLAQKVRAARKRAGLTLDALGARVGVRGGHHKQLIWQMENPRPEQGAFKFGTVYALAVALGVEVTDLLPTVSEVVAASGAKMVRPPQLTVPEASA